MVLASAQLLELLQCLVTVLAAYCLEIGTTLQKQRLGFRVWLIVGIIRVTIWVIGVINLLTKSP